MWAFGNFFFFLLLLFLFYHHSQTSIFLRKYSQHPNYFGEMMMWTGLFLSCSNQFQGLEWASAVSPLFVVFLLRFVSGVPLLQKAGMKKVFCFFFLFLL